MAIKHALPLPLPHPLQRASGRMSFLLSAAILCLLLGRLAPLASAQPRENWFLTLYNRNTGEFLQIDEGGRTLSYPLDIPGVTDLAGETDITAAQMAFTRDGRQAAFCYTRTTADPAQSDSRLLVRDIAARGSVLSIGMNPTFRCSVSPASFNEDGSLLAVSKINYTLGMTPPNPARPAWQLQVMETARGGIIAVIFQRPEVILEGSTEGILPIVRAFEGSTIIFNAAPYGTDSLANLPAYVWDINTNEIVPETSGRFNDVGGDLLPATGERVWFTTDSSLPSGQPYGASPRYNVVRYAADSRSEPITIFHDPDEVIVDVAFIEDGARLGILLLGSYDESKPDETSPLRWIALDRDGGVETLGSASGHANIFALPRGYGLFTSTDPTSAQITFTLAGETTRLWSSESSGWEVAFTPPISAIAPTFQPFVAWR